MAAAGKDADPMECPWHFEGRGRRQAAIIGRRKLVRISRRDH